jgi:exocyst complex component 1
MARSSADDMQLKRGCEAAISAKEKDREAVVLCMRVAKGRGVWGKTGKLGSRHMAKPRVLAITSQCPSSPPPRVRSYAFYCRWRDHFLHPCMAAKAKGQRTKSFLRVLKDSNGGVLEVRICV